MILKMIHIVSGDKYIRKNVWNVEVPEVDPELMEAAVEFVEEQGLGADFQNMIDEIHASQQPAEPPDSDENQEVDDEKAPPKPKRKRLPRVPYPITDFLL